MPVDDEDASGLAAALEGTWSSSTGGATEPEVSANLVRFGGGSSGESKYLMSFERTSHVTRSDASSKVNLRSAAISDIALVTRILHSDRNFAGRWILISLYRSGMDGFLDVVPAQYPNDFRTSSGNPLQSAIVG